MKSYVLPIYVRSLISRSRVHCVYTRSISTLLNHQLLTNCSHPIDLLLHVHRSFVSETMAPPFQDHLKSLAQLQWKNVNLRQLDQLRQLVVLLYKYPEMSNEVWKSGLVSTLVVLKDCGTVEVEQQARLALTLLGYAPPYAGRGIRILSLDGGGTRGLIPIIILKYLEEKCKCPTHELFDYVCGTSTGAIVIGLLCIEKSPIEMVETAYRDLSTKVFKMNNLLGISQLFLTHAFYDAKLLQSIIRSYDKAEGPMYTTVADPKVPRLSFVSTVVNQPVVQPFLFCNYRHHPANLESSHYLRSSDTRIWEAVMSSTAAPGYFEEVKLGSYVHQDGGLLTNNPCGLALHEARLLWGRNTPIQCIVSLGTGLYLRQKKEKSKGGKKEAATTLRDKLTKLVASATDTEAVHTILRDVLPQSSYFRFNPELSEDIAIDESNPEKLELLVQDAHNYVRTNRDQLERAAACLMAQKKPQQKVQEWMNSHWTKLQTRTRSLATRQ